VFCLPLIWDSKLRNHII